jgi:hypothetical protein
VVVAKSQSDGARLIAPDEKAWFERQPPALRKKIIVDLREAQACIAHFSKRDGAKEAAAAAKSSQPRFYTGISNGVHVYRTVPGIKGCFPSFTDTSESGRFRELPEAYSGPPRTLQVQRLCGAAASRFAAAFNRTLAMVKPDVFRAVCPTGQLQAR